MFDFPSNSPVSQTTPGGTSSNTDCDDSGGLLSGCGNSPLTPVYVSASAPAPPILTGSIWFSTVTSNLSVWVGAPDDGSWEEAGGECSGTGKEVYASVSQPTSPENGNLWYNPSTGALKIWISSGILSAWRDISPGSTGCDSEPPPPAYVSVSEPNNPKNRYFWFNPQTLELKVWYNSAWNMVSKSFPEFLNYEGTGKVNGSLLYYNASAGGMKADNTWTVSTITDGGNF